MLTFVSGKETIVYEEESLLFFDVVLNGPRSFVIGLDKDKRQYFASQLHR